MTVRTRSQLNSDADSNLADNTTGDISPADVRGSVKNLADSALLPEDHLGINAASAKTTPVDADLIGLIDSAASNVLKKVTWANIKATLKTYFDSLATTLTNKRITKRIGTTASTSSLTVDSDAYDQYNVTALAAAITVNAPTGTPTNGQELVLRFLDNGTARAFTSWNAAFRALGVTLPTTTVISKTLYVLCIWNAADSKWDVVDVKLQDASSGSAATDTVAGVVELATAAEVATGTDTGRVPSVSTMGSHQGVAKAWCSLNGTGTIAIKDSYGVSSISDLGTGNYRVNFSTTRPSADFAAVAACGLAGGGNAQFVRIEAKTTDRVDLQVVNLSMSAADASDVNVVVLGD